MADYDLLHTRQFGKERKAREAEMLPIASGLAAEEKRRAVGRNWGREGRHGIARFCFSGFFWILNCEFVI